MRWQDYVKTQDKMRQYNKFGLLIRLWMGTSWSAPSCPWPVGEGFWRTWPWRCRRCRGTGSPCPKPHGSSTSHPWAFRERRSCSWPAKKGTMKRYAWTLDKNGYLSRLAVKMFEWDSEWLFNYSLFQVLKHKKLTQYLLVKAKPK